MGIALPIKRMSMEDKIQAMEIIWQDLCNNANSLASPLWHKGVLGERERKLKNGGDEFMDWEKAKNQIRKKVS